MFFIIYSFLPSLHRLELWHLLRRKVRLLDVHTTMMSGISTSAWSTLGGRRASNLVYYLSTCHDIAALGKVRSTKPMMLVLVEIVICILLVIGFSLVRTTGLLLVHWASTILRRIDTHLVLHHITHMLLALRGVLVPRESGDSFGLLSRGHASLNLAVVSTTWWQGFLLETLVMRIMLQLISVSTSLFFAFGSTWVIHLGHLCLNLLLGLSLVHTLAHQNIHE